MNFLRRLLGTLLPAPQAVAAVEDSGPLPELKVVQRKSSDGTCESLEVEVAGPNDLKRVLLSHGYTVQIRVVGGGMTNKGGYDFTKTLVMRNEVTVAQITPGRPQRLWLEPALRDGAMEQEWMEFVRLVFGSERQSSQ